MKELIFFDLSVSSRVRKSEGQKDTESHSQLLELPDLALCNVYWDAHIAYKRIHRCGAPTINDMLRFRHQLLFILLNQRALVYE